MVIKIWKEDSDKSLKMTNVVAKKSSKSFLEGKVVEQTVLEPIEVAKCVEEGGELGQIEENKDVFMAENLPTYAKSYILPRKMHRVENKAKVAPLIVLSWIVTETIISGAWNKKEECRCSGVPDVHAEGRFTAPS